MDIRIAEKYALTVEEAAEYFHIGINYLRRLIKKDPNAEWILWHGSRATIKRKTFESILDTKNAI